MIVTSKVCADLQALGFPPIVNAVQDEQYSRRIQLSLYDAGVLWQVPTGVYIAMCYSKPDGTKGYYDTLPDGTQAWSATGNTVSIFVAPQMLTVPGVVLAQLEIIYNQSILATFPLRVRVAENLAAPLQTSEDYVNWLQWMEDQLTQRWNDAVESGDLTGPPGADAVLENSKTEFQVGSSGTEAPTGIWNQKVPSVPQGKYLWVRTTVRFNSGDPIVMTSVAYSGIDGTSASLKSSVTEYQIGDSGIEEPTDMWSAAIPEVPQGKYLWVRTTVRFNTGDPVVMTGVSRFGIDGEPAILISSRVDYQVSDSGKEPTAGAWSQTVPDVPQGKYLWTRTTATYNTGAPVVTTIPTRFGLDGTGAMKTVNGKTPDSSGNVQITAEDVGARPGSWMPTAAQVGALPTGGGTMTGAIAMSGKRITNLGEPAEGTDAVNMAYVKTIAVTVTLLASGWSASAPYTQAVTVAGMTGAKRAEAYPEYSEDNAANLAIKEACTMVSFAKRAAGAITFTCLEDKPTVDIPVTVEVYV